MIPRVCYVTDGERGTAGRPQAEVIERAVSGGLEMLVLRMRDARTDAWVELLDRLLPLRAKGLHILASRRLDLARAYELDGVHLAADSVSVAEARSWLGPKPWIGYSAHSGKEALHAQTQGASYVTLSPIYPTESKPATRAKGIAWLAESTAGLDIPVMALGGIQVDRVAETRSAGAWGVAVVSAIGAAPEPENAVREFLKTEDRR